MGNIPAAIGKEVVFPALELMSAADSVQNFLAGLETEVVGVVQA